MQFKAYLNYFKKRVNAHGIHSPFVFEFYNKVIKQSKLIKDAGNNIRKEMILSDKKINIDDFGAGSKFAEKTTQRKVSDIAKRASVNKKFGKLITQLLNHYQIEYVVELGTSLGIGTSYLAAGESVKKIITVEGAESIAKIASQNFEKRELKNIQLINQKFDDVLDRIPELIPKIDLVYIDGNHRYEPTINYFNYFVEKIKDDGFLIFDDIYWSSEMQQAWSEICNSDKINVSIDMFRMGIVCKRPQQAKEHFVLKF